MLFADQMERWWKSSTVDENSPQNSVQIECQFCSVAKHRSRDRQIMKSLPRKDEATTAVLVIVGIRMVGKGDLGGNGDVELVIMFLCDVDDEYVPKVGMLFESLEAARIFYRDYAKHAGFSTKIRNTNKSKKSNEILN
ncbi:hypothetical protein PIB30_051203 [Stylosanthes scabra]|uniref:Uncharacterized protein n=1 Tax=Stylosanthes scabra TaxID=79078 RepID=A0ABU6YKA2_9FABA|nr:hypothetical protein [Stylosanthes scabra]